MNYRKVIKGIYSIAEWALEDIIWYLSKPYYRTRLTWNSNCEITIGITTYKDRYYSCLKPLLSKICVLFPEALVIITANGHFDREGQSDYLKKINKYSGRFKNTRLITFDYPTSLSRMWNTIISKARGSVVLVMNDDVKIKSGFRRFICTSGILKSEIATINLSWSHYFFSQSIVERIGWFDEGLKEIGGEDDDYLARLAIAGIDVNDFSTHTLAGRGFRNRKDHLLNSYGKDMSKERGGYSTLNSDFLESKWEVSSSYFPGSVKVRNGTYWKLK